MERKVITDYDLVRGEDTFSLWKGVQEKLKTGWQPFGSPSVSTSVTVSDKRNQESTIFIQAMVKYMEES